MHFLGYSRSPFGHQISPQTWQDGKSPVIFNRRYIDSFKLLFSGGAVPSGSTSGEILKEFQNTTKKWEPKAFAHRPLVTTLTLHHTYTHLTLPKTNSSHLKIGRAPKGNNRIPTYSNHPFSGATVDAANPAQPGMSTKNPVNNGENYQPWIPQLLNQLLLKLVVREG